MLVHYPSLPVNDVYFPLHDGDQLRDLIKTCADKDIEYKLLYDHGRKFHYTSDCRRTAR